MRIQNTSINHGSPNSEQNPRINLEFVIMIYDTENKIYIQISKINSRYLGINGVGETNM